MIHALDADISCSTSLVAVSPDRFHILSNARMSARKMRRRKKAMRCVVVFAPHFTSIVSSITVVSGKLNRDSCVHPLLPLAKVERM